MGVLFLTAVTQGTGVLRPQGNSDAVLGQWHATYWQGVALGWNQTSSSELTY